MLLRARPAEELTAADKCGASLETSLATWEQLHGSWESILETAKSRGDHGRSVVAEENLGKCKRQLARLAALLVIPIPHIPPRDRRRWR